MNKHFSFGLTIVTLIATICFSCTQNGTNKAFNAQDSIPFETFNVCDSIIDASNSTIIVNATVSQPKENVGLISNFNKELLNISLNDSISAQNAIQTYVKNILEFYKTPNNECTPDLQDETEKVSKYTINHSIFPIYNRIGYICIKKTSELAKDGTTTIETNEYLTFNTTTGERIIISDIIAEEYSGDVNTIIKNQLMKQEDVTNQSQLIDLGYFNIDHLSINNNFYLTEDSIVFAYEPYEIACLQVGEVRIPVSFETLSQFLKEDSKLSNLIK